MKIVYDNLAFSLQKAGGVSAVWAGLLTNIDKKYILKYIEWSNQNIFRKHLILPQSKIEHRFSINPKINKITKAKFRCSNKFIFHSSIYRTCNNPNALNVVTLHDFIDKTFNQNYFVKTIKWYLMKNSLFDADAIICVSQNTKKDLLHYLPKISSSKVYVVNNGKSEEFYRLENRLQTEEFVLFVGKRNDYKNFKVVVEALKTETSKKLIIVGGGQLEEHELELLKSLGEERYSHKELISNEELNTLYNKAFCLVYPSLYEGFGIPVIEAQSAGCPVIAANKSSLPEVLSDSGILLNNVNTKEIGKAFQRLEDHETRNQHIELGLQNAARFSWNKMASEYIKVYRELWENN
ncbi:glycosyltransferase family 1 protein [uncultured Draconibacterium sp.]|uniref:glycosyltransferase family 4 protein n=1 Tax=uncultured Draconibacterium sp. TaxID=1573823 RepID=UPI0025E19FCF|nr:glycosyltransferase family 1 protein [uncultured Draconibacterium sp.]